MAFILQNQIKMIYIIGIIIIGLIMSSLLYPEHNLFYINDLLKSKTNEKIMMGGSGAILIGLIVHDLLYLDTLSDNKNVISLRYILELLLALLISWVPLQFTLYYMNGISLSRLISIPYIIYNIIFPLIFIFITPVGLLLFRTYLIKNNIQTNTLNILIIFSVMTFVRIIFSHI
jgi:hypothetical protein